MKSNNTKIIALFALLLTFALSSCIEEDSFIWRNAALDSERTIQSRSDYSFKDNIYIDKGHTSISTGGRYEIDDLRYINGKIIIHTETPIIDVTLRVPDTNMRLDLPTKYRGENIFDDPNTQRFLDDLVHYINKYGDVTIWVDGGYSRYPISIEIITNVDAYSRRY